MTTTTTTSRPTTLSPLELAIAQLEGARNSYARTESWGGPFEAERRAAREAYERAIEILEEAFAA